MCLQKCACILSPVAYSDVLPHGEPGRVLRVALLQKVTLDHLLRTNEVIIIETQ